MTNMKTEQSGVLHSGGRWQSLALVLTVVLGLASASAILRWIDAHRPPVDARQEEERLYVTGAAARRLSLNFNGLVADWYWMRSLQYVGRRMLSEPGHIQLDDLSNLDLKLLAPLLDTTTALDPQFMAAYEYAAVVLPAIDEEEAIKLLEKGIAANPQSWRLYHHLGYIYWQRRDYRKAGEIYRAGARIPGALPWMGYMSARMQAEGGSRQTAREMYRQMQDQSDDLNVKQVARWRLMQLDSFDERDVIRRVLKDYAARMGRCAGSWAEVAGMLRAARLRVDAAGAPLDPANVPYILDKGGCDVDLDRRSIVPYK